jgi:hypothetical protein
MLEAYKDDRLLWSDSTGEVRDLAKARIDRLLFLNAHELHERAAEQGAREWSTVACELGAKVEEFKIGVDDAPTCRAIDECDQEIAKQAATYGRRFARWRERRAGMSA